MKSICLSVLTVAGFSMSAFSLSAIDAYRFSQPDLKGTARFMSMGGAFGALGGDLSTLSQNPAGIGIYRSNEIGFTVDLDVQNSTAEALGQKSDMNQTKFLLNNIGGVATMRLPSNAVPNLNFGFTYNKAVSFNRQYGGTIPRIGVSMSNYIAGIANNSELNPSDLASTDNYNPYSKNNIGWLPILGYDGFLINPDFDGSSTYWTGQWGDSFTDPNTGTTYPATSGSAYFNVMERGSVDEYNIAIGGNISNVVFWGMNFDIVNFDYRLQSLYGENLTNAWVENEQGEVKQTDSDWNMQNLYRANGTGFNYQIGLIVKPVQEFRLGLAVHTPTWYNLTETFSADIIADYYGNRYNPVTNDGIPGVNDMSFRSPWKIIASAAGVIGSKFIISADYEWNSYTSMKFSEPSDNYYYSGWDWDYYNMAGSPYNNDAYYDTNQDIKEYYRQTNTLRIGAEYRITPKFSVRAGYSFVSSPVKEKAKEGKETIYTAGTMTNYRFDDTTNYITCGLGYRTGGFYADLAYVYKHMNSVYHAFSSDPDSPVASPSAKLGLSNNQIVLSMGYKF